MTVQARKFDAALCARSVLPVRVIRDPAEPAASPGIVRYAPEAEVSYPAATQRIESITKDRPPIAKLESEGVIQQRGHGFLLDENRVAYLRYLRRERKRSPRTQADADHVRTLSWRRSGAR